MLLLVYSQRVGVPYFVQDLLDFAIYARATKRWTAFPLTRSL
jgi:hypothetical protein